ncbi:hypothetical protein [Jeongeupia sp. USM3]|uniref:hypothetical protein n=1 Tax=Jeongeupia sp. USM3 TaxID=1906741 RepID=UPI001438CD1F|nr:hypothetical protein [Jeongeupia sp. USM3]
MSTIDKTVNTGGTGIATKKRALESKVLVDDGQVVVLGGLIQDQLDNAVNKVPMLGDVPGWATCSSTRAATGARST